MKHSKGEIKVANLLRRGGLQFKQEVSFQGLYGINANHLLRFDFVVYKGNQIYCCIDFDGRQHFVYVPYFHKSPIAFRRQKEYDIRKNKFCLKNKIPLIRIPYWELENLTLQKIFNTPEFIVKTPNHNINLIQKGVK